MPYSCPPWRCLHPLWRSARYRAGSQLIEAVAQRINVAGRSLSRCCYRRTYLGVGEVNVWASLAVLLAGWLVIGLRVISAAHARRQLCDGGDGEAYTFLLGMLAAMRVLR